MKTCTNTHCNQEIPENAQHCPYCGKAQSKSKSAMPWFVVGAVMLLFAGILLAWRIVSSIDTQTSVHNDISDQNPQYPNDVSTSTLLPKVSPTILATRTKIAITETSQPPTSTEISTSTVCPGAPRTRISINDLVRVITTNNDRLVLRSVPEIDDATEMRRLDEGTQLKVFDGPVCVQDPTTSRTYWFWEVRIKGTNIVGWAAEGDSALYYIETVR